MSEWNEDAEWNYSSHSIHSAGSDGFLNAESSFNMDFNNDSAIGNSYTTVESEGSVELKKDSKGKGWVELLNL